MQRTAAQRVSRANGRRINRTPSSSGHKQQTNRAPHAQRSMMATERQQFMDHHLAVRKLQTAVACRRSVVPQPIRLATAGVWWVIDSGWPVTAVGWLVTAVGWPVTASLPGTPSERSLAGVG